MKIHQHLKFFLRVLVLLTVLFFHIKPLLAVAFPFREFAEGDPVPDVTLRPVKAEQERATFSQLKGKPFLAVFWGADLPEKKEHATKVLAELEQLGTFLQERDVRRLSVDVQNDTAETISEVIGNSKSSMDVYVDENQKAYATLGIFVMPTVLLVNKEGKVAAGLGYSRDLVDRVKGAVEIMLGEKTARQVAAELRPEMKEVSDAEKTARRHFDFGMVMKKRGQLDAARREFNKAVETNPQMEEALLQLGCLYLDSNELERAEELLDKALAVEPDSLKGAVCHGELLRRRGLLEKAETELRGIVTAHPESYEASYYLGHVLAEQRKDRYAMDSYKQAYLKILRHAAAEQ